MSNQVDMTVEGSVKARLAADILVANSASFECVPYPDGVYRFTVKPEAVGLIHHLQMKPRLLKFTVVGTEEGDPDSRIAAHVEAEDWQDAVARVAADREIEGLGGFILAGVFDGHIHALDEQ